MHNVAGYICRNGAYRFGPLYMTLHSEFPIVECHNAHRNDYQRVSRKKLFTCRHYGEPRCVRLDPDASVPRLKCSCQRFPRRQALVSLVAWPPPSRHFAPFLLFFFALTTTNHLDYQSHTLSNISLHVLESQPWHLPTVPAIPR